MSISRSWTTHLKRFTRFSDTMHLLSVTVCRAGSQHHLCWMAVATRPFTGLRVDTKFGRLASAEMLAAFTSTSISFVGMLSRKSSRIHVVTLRGNLLYNNHSLNWQRSAFCQEFGFMFLPVHISSCLKPSTPIRATAWSKRGKAWHFDWNNSASNSCWMQFLINRSTSYRYSEIPQERQRAGSGPNIIK